MARSDKDESRLKTFPERETVVMTRGALRLWLRWRLQVDVPETPTRHSEKCDLFIFFICDDDLQDEP